MKYSISNLAWGDAPLDQVIPKLANTGLQGVEIAPTAIWPNLDNLRDEEITDFKEYLERNNLVVSGIQSLLYGHPELQLLDQSCWGDLRKHLENLLRIGGLLGADVAVFGSPRNRVRGNLDVNSANELAEIFLKQLIPSLIENDVILTLEPNAPEYGADYLITYEEVINLSQRINSENIRPQIDTGCLWMVKSSPENAYALFTPAHIHLSVPRLKKFSGTYNFGELIRLAKSTNYDGWLVIEMLSSEKDSLGQVMEGIDWLTNIEKGISIE